MEPAEPEPNRRSVLSLLTFGLVAIFNLIIGVPIVCYAIDPRHRKGAKSNFKLVEGVKLNEIGENTPVQGVIRDVRVDGWTLYPNDVIGRVWVVQKGTQPDLSSADKVTAFNAKEQSLKEAYLLVFTTICPHLGCSVNLDSAGGGFACPCHSATFTLAGAQAVPATNPAKRGMDTLEWEIDSADPNRINVKYQNFSTSIAEKKTI
ncbi:MAG: Rieske 2Fe-2S domain-containing protein [Planctomycetes bacterium]|nr:Rieske 2Fe-2S domain-containing protein [Planctomycetota bacterium]